MGASTVSVAPATARQTGNSRRAVEETSSTVATLQYSGYEGNFPGFPDEPDVALFDPGIQFDTTSAEVTRNGAVLHYQLPFAGKPYVLTHEGDGKYVPRGSVSTFETDGSDWPGLEPGRYRATVREVVTLYEKGGHFDWSVTRVDFYAMPNMVYGGSSLIIVWDEDGPSNENVSEYRTEQPNLMEGRPELNCSVLRETYDEIYDSAMDFMEAGRSNPGGN